MRRCSQRRHARTPFPRFRSGRTLTCAKPGLGNSVSRWLQCASVISAKLQACRSRCPSRRMFPSRSTAPWGRAAFRAQRLHWPDLRGFSLHRTSRKCCLPPTLCARSTASKRALPNLRSLPYSDVQVHYSVAFLKPGASRLRCDLHGRPFKCAVDAEHKATELQICSFSQPHMRTFHASWMGFFSTFFSTFAPAPLAAYLKREDTLGLYCRSARAKA